MKLIIILFLFLNLSPLFSQEQDSQIFDEITKRGNKYITPIKDGEIEFLKKEIPPKDTWLYASLEKYKENLDSKDIHYGSIIMPSTTKDSDVYSYNEFAYDIKKERYYFVAIVSYKVIGDSVQFDNSYLFTEKKSLENWWMSIVSFYRSDELDEIPKEFVFEVCPPPPFKE